MEARQIMQSGFCANITLIFVSINEFLDWSKIIWNIISSSDVQKFKNGCVLGLSNL